MRKWFFALIMTLCGCKSLHIHTAFLTPVCVKPYKAYKYHIAHDVQFMVNKKTFTIPKGFKTDLASIPRIVWPILSPFHSSLIRPAIVHDWFYKNSNEFAREDIDLIFYHMLKNDGISKTKALIMYYAVRMFGFPFYVGN